MQTASFTGVARVVISLLAFHSAAGPPAGQPGSVCAPRAPQFSSCSGHTDWGTPPEHALSWEYSRKPLGLHRDGGKVIRLPRSLAHAGLTSLGSNPRPGPRSRPSGGLQSQDRPFATASWAGAPCAAARGGVL